MIGLVEMISLYGLHSLVTSVRYGAMMGGRGMNFRSLACGKFIHELYMARVLVLCWVCRILWSMNMLWSRMILSW